VLFQDDLGVGRMAAFSSPPGLLMETRTSKVVTLSFSRPSVRSFVTLPLKVLSIERLHLDPRWLGHVDLADIALVPLAFSRPRLVSPSVMMSVADDPSTRIELTASRLPIARQDDSIDREVDGGVAQLLFRCFRLAWSCATCARA